MINPKKKWGQNFLHDSHVLNKIRDALQINTTDQVLEIGPGLGALTELLVPISTNYTAIEIDPRCVQELQKICIDYPHFHLVHHDFLKVPLEPWINTTKIVGNLPYNISTPIMKRIASYLQPNKIVCMFAKGTAERYTAKEGTRHFSSGTIFMQSFFDISVVCDVKKGSFFPPPKIDSQVLSFVPKKNIDKQKTFRFTEFVQKLFSYRKKTLLKAIRNAYGISVSECLVTQSNISLQKRPEELSMEQFHRLFDVYNEVCHT